MAQRIGVDVGGTNVKFALISPNGEILYSNSTPTRSEMGYEYTVNNIKQAIVTTATTIFSPIKSVPIGNKFKAIKITLTFNIHLVIKFNILSWNFSIKRPIIK